MYSHSSRTVRISGIPPDAEVQDLVEYAKWLSEGPVTTKSWIFRRIGATSRQPEVAIGIIDSTVVSLAPQMQYKTGTITFSSKAIKRRAVKRHGRWKCDDVFNSLTVLHAAAVPELDICAVHGLNGNAFDTWAADGHMWLRDFLPTHARFRNSRIMTFGYSSLLQDGRNAAGLTEWAHSLLQSVASVRKSQSEGARPLIFVCHSLGGLVVREAMIQLHDFPGRYQGLGVDQCGLLFLSTPHSGATAADWNDYMLELAEHIGKIRGRDFTQMLGSFNNESRKAKERFGLINPIPPYVCLGETRESSVRGYSKMIVTLDSAGLNNQPAQGVDGADHRTICRYARDTDAGYVQITECLEHVSDRLQNDNAGPATTTLSRRLLSPPDHPWGGTLNARDGPARAGNARGGDAWGGDARGGDARGGDAWGGDAWGGAARGGDARGDSARGGDARGGDAWFS
ncbi:hypothetical protein DL764_000212 [Monosporascus ibericus]|uniref:DUF676 domain-containing protein n=1 Tax=Monosporascus ibericus TaxID=155417 RepID=A0A4Q4TXZ5_9PEZI|nr:hypothetical protein DL764_000212 [Monosporascus ibericus]